MDQPEVSNPSHHLMAIWYSFDSRCKPKPGEGTTDSQEEARGAATDRRRALLAGEEDSNKMWKCCAWIIILFLFYYYFNNDIHACTIQTHYCYTIYFNESTVLLTNTTNQPTVPLTYPWTASLPMMALATDLTRDM